MKIDHHLKLWRNRMMHSFYVLGILLIAACATSGQARQQRVWTEQEKPILAEIKQLRSLPDSQRSGTTKDLALRIRRLPAGANKRDLAISLSHLSTEGDFGHQTLHEVARTLADSLRETPVPADKDKPAEAYLWLAALNRYE